ncbi:MAG: 5-formyltetrahydrofolate cyclo-ligase [Balneolaceae bacterium]
MSIRQRKQEIRKECLSWRESLSEEQIRKRSHRIIDTLRSGPELSEAKRIHCYLPIPGRGEVDITTLVASLLGPEKKVIVPRISASGQELNHYLLEEMAALKPNSWGIPEPVGGKQVSASYPDLILVPVVAADREKNRIGYGKGYYDRFLAQTDAKKIGLLYRECLLAEELPTEPFDIPLDLLVTDEGIF